MTPVFSVPIGLALLATLAAVPATAYELPDPRLTPGAVSSSDPGVVCVHGYSATVRPPYDAQWRRFRVTVFQRYGIPHNRWRLYTVDHLVPLALGGAPEDLRNVWPQPKTDAVEKDEVEDALLAAACYRNATSLTAAQAAMARNWTITPVALPPIRNHHYGRQG